ncbi:MAG: hypothetical protein V4649_08030 [Bacteroidota bacterium]
MAKEFHDNNSESIIYHNNADCESGVAIEKKHLKTGKGRKIKLCENCKKLNKLKQLA